MRMPAAAAGVARMSVRAPHVNRLAVPACAVLVAVASFLFFPDAFVTGDVVFGLLWGEQLLNGELTSFYPGPTPHPLVIAWGALVSVLGDDIAYRATQLFWGHLSFGAVVAAAAGLAWRLWSPWAALLAASVLLTSGSMAWLAFLAAYDLAFAAFVLAAISLELRRGGRSHGVLALLAVAGLIRPEAWLLAGGYWLWAWSGWAPRQRVSAGAMVALAPGLWMLMDGLVTGDPLWSFHVTDSGSDELYRQYTPLENLAEGGRDLVRYVGPVGLGLAALAIPRLVRARRRELVPACGVLAATLGVFIALTAVGMASNPRYLLVPACLLAIAAGSVASPALSAGRLGRAIAVGASVLLVMQALGRVGQPTAVRERVAERASWSDQARKLVARPEVDRILRTCPVVAVPSLRLVPSFAYVSGRAPDRWTADREGRSRPDAYLAPAAPAVAELYLTRRRFNTDAAFALPPGLRPMAATPAWRLYVSERSECARDARAAARASASTSRGRAN